MASLFKGYWSAMNYPIPDGVEILPALFPSQWFVSQAKLGEGLVTCICIATPAGLNYSFWPGATAIPFAKELTKFANLTSSGLYVPGRKE